MKKLFWHVCLAFYLIKYKYERNIIKAFRWTFEEEWVSFWGDGYSPQQTIIRDMEAGV